MFVLIILEKITETWLKLSQGSKTVLQKMANYQEVGVKVTNTQPNKLKSAAEKKKDRNNSKIKLENFED